MIPIPLAHQNKIPTCGQIKRLTQKSEEILENEGKAVTPNNLAVSMFALITTVVCIPMLLSKGHLAPLMRPTKFPEIPVSLERNTEVFRHPLL